MHYAMTLNKAQGKTFSRGLLLLTRDVFAHGQLYVGLTRFGAASDVAVLVSPGRRIDGRAVVLNVVSSSLAQCLPRVCFIANVTDRRQTD